MANKIHYIVATLNTVKVAEYWNPVTLAYQDDSVLTNIPAGTYTGLKARLKGSNPEIVDIYPGSVNVSDEQDARVSFILNGTFSEVGRVRQSSLLDPTFPIYSALPPKLLDDAVITNAGTASLSIAIDNNNDFGLFKTGSGLSFVTLPTLGNQKAAFTCTEIVIDGIYVEGTPEFADILVGVFAENTNLNLNAVAFRVNVANDGRNYKAINGNVQEYPAINPQPPTIGEHRLYVVSTHDYITGALSSNGTLYWGVTTDFNPAGSLSEVTPGFISVLNSQKLGIGLSSGTNMALAIKSVTQTYYGGSGGADHQVVAFEDGTPYIDNSQPNRRFLVQSAKGIAADGKETADQSCLRIFSVDITASNPTTTLRNEALLFVKRGNRVEGDFSAGVMFNRLTNKWYVYTPVLGHQKNFSTPFTSEMLVTSSNILTGVTVFEENQRTRQIINGEDPHDPAQWYVHTDGTIYCMYSVQTGGPTRTRFAKSTNGGIVFNRYDDPIETDEANADDEGNKIFNYKGKILGINTRKHTQIARLYDLLTGKFLGEIADPVIQKGLLSNAQQSHDALLVLPDDTLLNFGFTTDPPGAPLNALDTSYYPPASSKGAHIYTNGVTVIHTLK